VLERVLSAAAWSPSGSNLQPWNSYVLTGAPLAELKKRAGERVAAGDPWDEREYEMYPPALKSPYRKRRTPSARSVTGNSVFGARRQMERLERPTSETPSLSISTRTSAKVLGPRSSTRLEHTLLLYTDVTACARGGNWLSQEP